LLYAIMEMLIFALFAKVRHVIESIRDSKLGGHQVYDRSVVYTVVITLTMYKFHHSLLYRSGLQI